jgi:hypothetical protein
MSTLSIVILLVVAGIVTGAIFSPKFRQLLRIRGGKAVDAGTTALEKEQDQYKVLVAKIPAQRTSVATTKAGAVIAQKKLTTLTSKLSDIEAEFKQADAVQAPADVVAAIEADYAAQNRPSSPEGNRQRSGRLLTKPSGTRSHHQSPEQIREPHRTDSNKVELKNR